MLSLSTMVLMVTAFMATLIPVWETRLMTITQPRVMYSSLLVVQSAGLRESKELWHKIPLKLSTWLYQKPLTRLSGTNPLWGNYVSLWKILYHCIVTTRVLWISQLILSQATTQSTFLLDIMSLGNMSKEGTSPSSIPPFLKCWLMASLSHSPKPLSCAMPMTWDKCFLAAAMTPPPEQEVKLLEPS